MQSVIRNHVGITCSVVSNMVFGSKALHGTTLVFLFLALISFPATD